MVRFLTLRLIYFLSLGISKCENRHGMVISEKLRKSDRLNDFILGPRRARTCLRVYADIEGPDQPAHPRSLIRAFHVPLIESFDTIE